MREPDPLTKIPLFSALSEADRRLISREIVEARYGRDQFIFREGDPADHFYIVKEGAVKCVKTSRTGKEITLKVLIPGDLFCCSAAVFDGASHPGCAQPMGEVCVYRLSKKSYFDILQRNSDAAMAVIKYLGRRLYEAQENAKILALDPAEQRLASLLVHLAEQTGIPDREGIRLSVRLTRQDLADMAGMTVETAIRIISRLKRAHLVIGTAKRIVIRDLGRLKQVAEEAVPSPPRYAGAASKT